MHSIKWALPILLLNVLLSKCAPVFFNKNLDKWTKELLRVSKNEYSNLDEAKSFSNRKYCGQSLKHLAGLILDKTDKEGKLIIEGSIVSNKLILKLGNIKEKEISINDILLPIETLSSKCINIRQGKKKDDSTILCLASKVLRNFWVNSITDAVLCKITKNRGKLPQYNYAQGEKDKEEKQNEKEEEADDEDEEADVNQGGKQNESLKKKANTQQKEQKLAMKKIIKEEFDEEQENEPKGLKVRIAKSKFGSPQVKINGKSVDEVQKNGSEKGKDETEETENQSRDESIESDETTDEGDVETE
ncbi:conserved Plasmodium protein, unknown function [Plasmodium knowlesi strain H]|uniref:PH domain-containing protein n=3 Tax=Plasmodium knowlesi TaxID=5850 RepID=A0A5K1UFD9_PLAKH|nr:PH domain-containing protein, putative [Plasmodium knowlesi strain H]OTN67321.1 Uncharacterized protein PKNOH_S06403400 [Plasmodium knowlesi]CAA9987309.1 PH domain-containing protein, putative [Plasmodium knowlesi strain H]SBO23414.1 conserved Plasmodium protein, unknown function [Plasmodium knowlesi strain H]SBO24673.1 conserved Plasmodium protein, unknown function [Plasmodium knowlesi strain H]VVS76783.1 PH domain-containing protein, putative [Plasmodium knowlesi strain H]|eukprot:XP_002258313.1 hypothetical protein, conserved in Plasmodium species [Plasmodium knowlesi strain H]